MDNFQDSLSDGGVYQCSAEDQGTTGYGTALILTGTVAYKLDGADLIYYIQSYSVHL